jgi:phosphatidylglycerophosphate synthase
MIDRPMANVLTAARVLLAVPFALLMLRGDARSAALAGLVLAAAIATDVLDGILARRRGTTRAAGAVFDHTADCLFVTAGLAAGVVRGVFPAVLPLLVAAAFAQYMADSYWAHRGGALRGSALGRWNGILYFAPLGGDVLVRLGARALEHVVTVLAWALVVSTVMSMIERLWALRPARAARAGKTSDRRGSL